MAGTLVTNTGPKGPDPGPSPGTTGAGAKPERSAPKSEGKPQSAEDWEKAREETRRKEELRRKMEEFKRKREAEAREKQRQREREAMEKELRERREQLEKEMAAAKEAAAREARLQAEKEAAEARARVEREAAEARARVEREAAEAKAKAEREAAEARQREADAKAKAEREAAEARQREADAKARAEREAAEAQARAERQAAEAKAKAEKEAAEKEAAAKAAAKKEADAKFAALKEAAAKKYAEKKARDAREAAAAKEAAATASKVSSASAPPPRTPSPKKPSTPASTANTTVTDDDAYSFRPYDRPRRPYAGTSQSSVYSESSYAPSQSTARTTPPPSNRGPYETKDPDKIVIRAVYAFNQAFLRTPIAQLVSGQGMVTDGLVLRITTEGLFIDDDVRGVPQREWDVKAWTMKLVEVWCPQIGPSANRAANAQKANQAFFRRSVNSDPTPEESDAYLANFLKVCKNTCRLASPAFVGRNGSDASGKGKDAHPFGGLHVLRASIRDQEGKRYVFVLQETEGWKVALGLQRLRKGTQVRALGVCSMALAETRTILGGLGY
ncbi:hypothetical protein AOCH_007708 [Aspergillus ochraceoroseus]|uniref:Trans-sialidase n=1 Tax=Aspergillus ochraceoroseus TaxID=138278 RepID=A0A0F8W3J7_9EURO|nr:hypothetical protein AOCH_007708 [Aspergillus ochraceoroseus]